MLKQRFLISSSLSIILDKVSFHALRISLIIWLEFCLLKESTKEIPNVKYNKSMQRWTSTSLTSILAAKKKKKKSLGSN